jgi:hypothetical protein
VSQSLRTLRDCQRLWRPDSRKTFSAPRSPRVPCAALWIPWSQRKKGWHLTSCFSKLPEARPLVLCTPSLLHRPHREGAPPCPVHWRIPSGQGLWQVARSRWAQGPRLQFLSLSRDPLLLCPGSPSCCRVPPNWWSLVRGRGLTSPCNTWLRACRGRSLLAAYSLTWEERGTERQKGTEAGARAISRCSPLWGGDIRQPPGLAPRGLPPSLLEGKAASATRYGTAALHPVPRSIASPAATLAAEPCPPGAVPAPATHPRAQTHAHPTNTLVHTHKHVLRAHSHTHGCVGWEPLYMIRALLAGRALVRVLVGGCEKPADIKVEDITWKIQCPLAVYVP